MAAIRQSIGLPDLTMLHKNESRTSRPSKPILSSDDIDFLVDRYRSDFDLFDYDI